MHRYSRAPDVSTSLRAHHQRWNSEPSSTTAAAVASLNNTKTSSRQGKVAADAGPKNPRVSGRYQKNRSSTLERDAKTSVTSKPSLSSTLQQIGNWARRSFRGHGGGGGKEAAGRRPKSLNDYVMTEVSSGVVVERRKSERFPSRDQSPVTTSSSGYASGGDGVPSRLNDEDLEDTDGHHLGRQIQRGGTSRGSRRYRRRGSMAAATEGLQSLPTPVDKAARPPPAAVPTTVKKCLDNPLPVYENLQSQALGVRYEVQVESIPVTLAQRNLNTTQNCSRAHPEVDRKRKLITPEVASTTGNASINEYLLPTRCLSFDTSSDSSTLRRSGNRSASPVYVNGNLLMTSLNQTSGWRSGEAGRRSRSRSLSSSRNRTLTNGDQSTMFNFAGVQQRLSFTPSFVAQSPPTPEQDGDWDDRLSTLSIGCRRPPVAPDRRCTVQHPKLHRSRSKSARRRLQFGNQSTTSVDQRPESLEECVRPLYRHIGPAPTISNVAVRNPPGRRSTGLFPGLGDQEESVYETISDHAGRSRLPLSRVLAKGLDVDGEHVYDNIDDFFVPPVPALTDIHQIPPPLPPPPLPARRPAGSHNMPLSRSEVVELDSNHVYTIADVLDSFQALAAHLPRAKQFIYDLQTAAYFQERRDGVNEGDRAARDAEGRWTAAAAMNRGSTNQQRATKSTEQSSWVGKEMDKSSTWRGGPAQRRLRHMYGTDDSQPIVVEDYVCSPGNPLSSERPRRSSKTASVTTSQVDGLYMAMKPGSKPPASTVFCCGRRGTNTMDSLPPSTGLTAANAARKPKPRTNRTNKETGRLSGTMSHSITELDRFDDVVDRAGRRTSKLFQNPPSFIDASSYMLDDTQPPLPRDISHHQRALSRSLVEGISHQSSQPTYANVANRKQNNSSMLSSTFVVDTTSRRRCSIVPEISPDDVPARHPNCASRSSSEDRQTGTGSSSGATSPVVGDARRPARRGRVSTGGLSKSLLAATTVQQHPTFSGVPSSSMSFHEVPSLTQTDRRRSSNLQWTSATCSGKEIFC